MTSAKLIASSIPGIADESSWNIDFAPPSSPDIVSGISIVGSTSFNQGRKEGREFEGKRRKEKEKKEKKEKRKREERGKGKYHSKEIIKAINFCWNFSEFLRKSI